MKAAPPYRSSLPDDDRTYFLTPMLRHFHDRPFHVQVAVANLDKTAIREAFKAQLLRSEGLRNWESEPPLVKQTQLLFRLSEDVFVHLEDDEVWVYAACPDVAGQVLDDWKGRFLLPAKEDAPTYFLLSSGAEGVKRQPVSLSRPCLHSSGDLALHYGDDFVPWEAELILRLQSQVNGLVVLRGDPGVGKSSFLRHLIARLAKTHRAFLVPTSHFGMLASPEMPGFWAGQNYRSKLRNLLLLEDAEALLGRRDGSNDAQVSNLLNMSDGLLGDSMKVQIIATVNASLDKLDPAITRRGRLTGYRQFRRLSRVEAQRLATAKQLTLGDGHEFSLADIYRGADSTDSVPAEPVMGFRR